MDITIRLAKIEDLAPYTKLLQETYQNTYVDESIGFTRKLFSEEVFNTPEHQKYLASNLTVDETKKTWLAFDADKLVGSITILERKDDFRLQGFYVAADYQDHGIGKKLWNLVLDFVKGKDIICNVYTHNTQTIGIYKKWGFVIDDSVQESYRHWPEWPEDVKIKYMRMRYSVRR